MRRLPVVLASLFVLAGCDEEVLEPTINGYWREGSQYCSKLPFSGWGIRNGECRTVLAYDLEGVDGPILEATLVLSIVHFAGSAETECVSVVPVSRTVDAVMREKSSYEVYDDAADGRVFGLGCAVRGDTELTIPLSRRALRWIARARRRGEPVVFGLPLLSLDGSLRFTQEGLLFGNRPPSRVLGFQRLHLTTFGRVGSSEADSTRAAVRTRAQARSIARGNGWSGR